MQGWDGEIQQKVQEEWYGRETGLRQKVRRNGQITEKETKEHSTSPMARGQPSHEFATDSDRDGLVCK